MSDEAERVRATLRVLDVLEFNGVPAAVVTADAVKALASLESQNQALQERAEKAEAALREIVETPAEVEFREGDCAYCESKTIARNALSPTQETDSE